MRRTIARVLSIAGSDSGGGAGIEADIKTIAALGAYACTAITAVTAQNTTGVYGIHPLPGDFVRRAIAAVLDDLGADAIKIGMLANAEIAAAIASGLPETIPLVLDPVMIASSGAVLLAPEAVAVLREALLPRATLVTPNLPETQALTGILPRTPADCERAAAVLLRLGAGAVLIKGGHAEGETVTDTLVHAGGTRRFTRRRLPGRHTHGTGCTLSAAIATGLAQGMTLPAAIERARDYLQRAIAEAPGFGRGNGPLWHGVDRSLEGESSFCEQKEAKKL